MDYYDVLDDISKYRHAYKALYGRYPRRVILGYLERWTLRYGNDYLPGGLMEIYSDELFTVLGMRIVKASSFFWIGVL